MSMSVLLSTWSDGDQNQGMETPVTHLLGRAEPLQSNTVVMHRMDRQSETVSLDNVTRVASQVFKTTFTPPHRRVSAQCPGSSLASETRLSYSPAVAQGPCPCSHAT